CARSARIRNWTAREPAAEGCRARSTIQLASLHENTVRVRASQGMKPRFNPGALAFPSETTYVRRDEPNQCAIVAESSASLTSPQTPLRRPSATEITARQFSVWP